MAAGRSGSCVYSEETAPFRILVLKSADRYVMIELSNNQRTDQSFRKERVNRDEKAKDHSELIPYSSCVFDHKTKEANERDGGVGYSFLEGAHADTVRQRSVCFRVLPV